MKKRLFGLFFAACLLLTAVSCEKEVIYDSTVTRTYDIMSRNWKATEDGFSVILDVPEITRDVLDYGSVQCFIIYPDGAQTCLPAQRYLSYEYVDETTGKKNVGYYQKLIDFEYNLGEVNVYYTMSDFYYETNPEELTVKVIVHY